ncbi:hypothetical protein T440DRAFT_515102 [Plenodomus tracheiphilus IPT5]|uniref:Uncharacterized protein n=1 Tax=Plenodomus tracheiphilus IPT5 TaxID=1408161 RepID=A0A6A7BGL7_9PLEO|nr:hypothetical protein T440DRAFT_515102 [Plenodomus tracheiphilus IPT5]
MFPATDYTDIDTSPPHDPYHLDTDTDTDTCLPYHPRFSSPYPRLSSEVHSTPTFTKTTLKLPQSTASQIHSTLSPSDILILPPTLTRLKVSIRSSSRSSSYTSTNETLRVVVAGNLRVRDVARQVCSKGGEEMQVWVRRRGEWQEVGGTVRVGDVSERGEGRDVEVRIVIGGFEGGRRRRRSAECERGVVAKGWEESGRGWEWRV